MKCILILDNEYLKPITLEERGGEGRRGKERGEGRGEERGGEERGQWLL